MPNILFASNNIAHWPGAVAGSVPGTFDPDRVPYSIALTNYEILNSPEFTPSTGNDTWFHFRFYAYDVDYNRADTFLQAYDPDGNLLFKIKKNQAQHNLNANCTLYDGTTSIAEDASIDWTFNKMNSLDVRYTAHALGLELRLYVNSSLASTLLLASNPNNLTAPARFSIGTGFTDNLSDYMAVSEILVADGDTRNARLDLLRPTAAGAYEQWLGSLVALADDDPTTGMTTIAGNQRQTVTLTPYSGASNISNFVVVSQTTRGQNSPTKLKHTVRLSGVDYDSAEIPVGFPLQYNMTDFKINPATSLPWEGSDLSAIETGFVSVA